VGNFIPTHELNINGEWVKVRHLAGDPTDLPYEPLEDAQGKRYPIPTWDADWREL
jgi:hypothetical protein